MKSYLSFVLCLIVISCEQPIDPNQVVNPVEPPIPVGIRGLSFQALDKQYFFPSSLCRVEYTRTKRNNKPDEIRLDIYAGKMIKNDNLYVGPSVNKPDSIFYPYIGVVLQDTTKFRLNSLYLTNQYSTLSGYSYLSSITMYNGHPEAMATGYVGTYVSEICQSGHIVIRKLEKNTKGDSLIVEGTFEAEVCRQVPAQTVVVDSRFTVFQGKLSLAVPFTTL